MKQKVVIIFLLAGIILTVGNLQYKEVYGLLSKQYIYAKGKNALKSILNPLNNTDLLYSC